MHITSLPLTVEELSKFSVAGESCYVGDPCYVFPDEFWGDFCDAVYSGPPDEEQIQACIERLKKDRAAGLYTEKLTDDKLRSTAEISCMNSSPRKAVIFALDGKVSLIVSATAYGDGGYPVRYTQGKRKVSGSFGVDAGVFSIIPLSVLFALFQGDPALHGVVTPAFSLGTVTKILNPKKGNLEITDGNGARLVIKTA